MMTALASASILCFTETWLQPDIESPVVRGKNQSLRSDRASGDRKGGVLVNLADNIKISNDYQASLDGVSFLQCLNYPVDNPFT